MKKIITILLAILIAIVAYFIFNYIYRTTQSSFFIEVSNSIIGMIFGGIVTVLLLFQQSAREEDKEKRIEIFKMKYKLYNEFFDRMWEVWEDEKIDEQEMKEILRLLRRISMFLDGKATDDVSRLVNKLIKLLTDETSDEEQTKEIEEIFLDINTILRCDLGVKKNSSGVVGGKEIIEVNSENLKKLHTQKS